MLFIPRITSFDPVTNTYANLEMKDYVKYLGLMTDSNLSWKYHIESLCHKIQYNDLLTTPHGGFSVTMQLREITMVSEKTKISSKTLYYVCMYE